jgi:hypothetical protein
MNNVKYFLAHSLLHDMINEFDSYSYWSSTLLVCNETTNSEYLLEIRVVKFVFIN